MFAEMNLILTKSIFYYKSLVIILKSIFLIVSCILIIKNVYSGLLSCYIFLSKLEKSNGTFNYSQIIILRWFRLVVPIIGMILFAYLVPLTGSGPMWKGIKSLASILYLYSFNILIGFYIDLKDGIQWFLEPCYKNWHRNILLTNNIYFDFPLEEYIVRIL